MDTIKCIDLLGELKSDKIYYLFKTSSAEINLEILSNLQKFESSLEFFSFYTKNNVKKLINFVNQLDKELNSPFNDDSINFTSNTDEYISKISKIILTLNLIQKSQEILNKNLLKLKQYINKILNNFKIKNIYQDKFLSLINNLQYNFSNNFYLPNNNYSLASTKVNSSTSLISCNKISSKNQNETNENQIKEEFFSKKQFSIINEECLSDIITPAFCEIDKKQSNKNLILKTFNNDSNFSDLNLSLRDMKFFSESGSKSENNSVKGNKSKNKRRNGKILKTKELLFSDNINLKNNRKSLKHSMNVSQHLINQNTEIKMYSDFLILIKNLYKSCLITAEEKIRLKKLIISKSIKITDFYINEFENIKNNNDKIATALKNFL